MVSREGWHTAGKVAPREKWLHERNELGGGGKGGAVSVHTHSHGVRFLVLSMLFSQQARLGNLAGVAREIGKACPPGSPPALTPFAAHCFGHALASFVRDRDNADAARATASASNRNGGGGATATTHTTTTAYRTIAIGVDPRAHSPRLADALARGAESVPGTRVAYCGLATTPACASFVHRTSNDEEGGRESTAPHASVMVTASHLPPDRNGFKVFLREAGDGSSGGLNHVQLRDLGRRAKDAAANLFQGSLTVPPTSGNGAVLCSGWVDWMPEYSQSLTNAVASRVVKGGGSPNPLPLQGMRLVLNAGNGAGGFFADVLKGLGADVSGSIHLEPNPEFPHGVPNPEYRPMIEETIRACQACQADLGIMLDTDADRCGFVVPTGHDNQYEPLNRNRLIALLGVIFAETAPGCAIVTDSVTSEGLAAFLTGLGLQHVRYLKGYANVIQKAQELTEAGIANAQVAVETSGHCAMQENRYLDDGTYTAARVVAFMAGSSTHHNKPLRDWISGYRDLDEVSEMRMPTHDGSLLTMQSAFDFVALEVERWADDELGDNDPATSAWEIDRDNLEGIRVRIGDGQFFMLRKSLHDPLVSLQIEAHSHHQARQLVVDPLLRLLESEAAASVAQTLDTSALRAY